MGLAEKIPKDASADALLDRFLEYALERGLELYPAQEEAILELFAGNHVILNTPTGSGKSLVALAMHFRAIARRERSFYTAPIKALVSEKFFDLCRDFGADNVGMMTGDASVNRDAPIICATAEILANLALREGERAPVEHVVMDEFHYYSDRERGVAWQIPLLTLPHATFLLMSATLGDTEFFVKDIEARTGRPVKLVKTGTRPVPLEFEYRLTPLHETIADLLEKDRAPVYIVHFTQRAASERAQSLMSMDFLSKEQKRAIQDEIGRFRFDTPYGKDLKRHVLHGVGVHHAGLLPKYRRLVERLAQKGSLRLICGTDTLGVGVNVPIRTVLFTQLCKFDGEKTRVLSVRDFQQIAGRAGRKGFDVRGYVLAQAPEHVVENRILEGKAGTDAKKLRKMVRKKPPEKGYAHWDEPIFMKLAQSEPESLRSSFTVSHAMLLHMLERPENGCRAIKTLLRSSHESPHGRRALGRTAIALFRSLVEAGVVEMLRSPDRDGRPVAVNADLQIDFSLNQALSLWVVQAVPKLDPDDIEYPANLLSLVEATLENPTVVLLAQLDKLKTETLTALKEEGVEYEERMTVLEGLEWPKPLKEFIYDTFNEFAAKNPWAADNIHPKAIAREMLETSTGFTGYVKEYGLARSEGVLLRYLSDAYKALVQTVPESEKTPEVYDACDWLGAVVRQVDSSLIDEWEALRDPKKIEEAITAPKEAEEYDFTRDEKAFGILIRNETFALVRALARKRYEDAGAALSNGKEWSVARFEEALAPYFADYSEIRTDAVARAPKHVRIDRDGERMRVEQKLVDPEEHVDWYLELEVDLEKSRVQGEPVLSLVAIHGA